MSRENWIERQLDEVERFCQSLPKSLIENDKVSKEEEKPRSNDKGIKANQSTYELE